MKQAGAPCSTDSVQQLVATRRVVLLGASNLTKGIGTVLETAYRAWGRPLSVVTALGHGRSYGATSSILGRQLPGILECGLWQVLADSAPIPTAGLITDIGNDLLYEQPIERIAGWVEECLSRLAALEARTVVTLLPVDNLLTLSRARFQLMRTIFFPHSRISLDQVAERALALNERVRRLARDFGCGLVAQRSSWYGFDPIHIRARHRPTAWREILAHWSETNQLHQPARGTLARTLYLQSRAPETRRLLGFEQRRSQPAGRLNDGTTIAVY
jgi:hypothetical protein